MTTVRSRAVSHFALRVRDCDAAVEHAARSGGRVAEVPAVISFEGDTPVPVRHALCKGPDGEQMAFLPRAVL